MPRPQKPGRNIEKVKDAKGTIRRLLKDYLSKYKLALIIVFVFAIGGTIFTIVGPKILGNATTEIFSGVVSKLSGGNGIDFNKVLQIILMLLGLYLLSTLFQIVQGIIMANVTQKLTYNLRDEMSKKINRLPMNYFDKKTKGETLALFSNDIDTLSRNLNQSITQIITSICTVIGIFIMMLSISWEMTIVSMLILPVALVLIKKIIKISQKYFKQQLDYNGHISGQIEENYAGHTIVKAFNGEKRAIEDFDKTNDILYRSTWKSQFLSGLMFPIMNFVGNIGYVAIAILGGYFAIRGRITVGNIQSFIQYNKQFIHPINQITQISGNIQSMIAAAERVFEFLNEKEEVEDSSKEIDTAGLKGNIEFKHVKFGYKKNKTIINDFSAKIRDGQKIAIVGPTGAGKTTIVKLLMRFYDVNE